MSHNPFNRVERKEPVLRKTAEFPLQCYQCVKGQGLRVDVGSPTVWPHPPGVKVEAVLLPLSQVQTAEALKKQVDDQRSQKRTVLISF